MVQTLICHHLYIQTNMRFSTQWLLENLKSGLIIYLFIHPYEDKIHTIYWTKVFKIVCRVVYLYYFMNFYDGLPVWVHTKLFFVVISGIFLQTCRSSWVSAFWTLCVLTVSASVYTLVLWISKDLMIHVTI